MDWSRSGRSSEVVMLWPCGARRSWWALLVGYAGKDLESRPIACEDDSQRSNGNPSLWPSYCDRSLSRPYLGAFL